MAIKKEKKKSVRITVTPNIEYSLKVLKKAVKLIDDAEVKGAMKYLETAAKGEKQSLRGKGCPDNRPVQREM